MKTLRRSKTNRVIAGIMGGFGEYLAIDAVVLRVVFLLFVLVTGFFPGVLAYIIAIFIIPEEGEPVIHSTSSDKVS